MLWLTTLVLTACLVGTVEPAKPFRWCTVNDKEKTKCADFVKGLMFVSNKTGVAIDPSCVVGVDDVDCMKKIKANDADFITLDTGKVYTAGKEYGLVPIAFEQTAGGYAGYYAVAVAKKATDVTLNTLKGKKTCHTGYRRTSGWNMPVGYLLANIGEFRRCGNPSDAASASKYFAESCVPGAPSGFDNLCVLCPDKKCSTGSKYAGYHGAFNCMKDGGGDVAFVKHLTTAEVVGSNMTTDYKYLCTNGKSEEVTADSHKNCNFAFSASHTVITRSGDNSDFVTILTKAAEYCQGNKTSTMCGGFMIFSSSKYSGGRDLLFKDSTMELLSVGGKNTYQKWLGEYSKSLDALYKSDPCISTTVSSLPTIKSDPYSSSVVFTSSYSLVVAMFVLVKAIL